MFQLIRDLAHARDVPQINIAAGVAHPKLKRAALNAALISFVALVVAVTLLWESYYDLRKHLDRQDVVLTHQSVLLEKLQQEEVSAP